MWPVLVAPAFVGRMRTAEKYFFGAANSHKGYRNIMTFKKLHRPKIVPGSWKNQVPLEDQGLLQRSPHNKSLGDCCGSCCTLPEQAMNHFVRENIHHALKRSVAGSLASGFRKQTIQQPSALFLVCGDCESQWGASGLLPHSGVGLHLLGKQHFSGDADAKKEQCRAFLGCPL